MRPEEIIAHALTAINAYVIMSFPISFPMYEQVDFMTKGKINLSRVIKSLAHDSTDSEGERERKLVPGGKKLLPS